MGFISETSLWNCDTTQGNINLIWFIS